MIKGADPIEILGRTFQNLFKQRLGVTPSEYRALVQNGHPDLPTNTVR